MNATEGPKKKSVYIDVDDEITAIIDKVKSAKEPIIALVLPKRASMLQSTVNMKLLKRAADQDDKKVVLITSEPSLMPLAGAAGLHVAHNLQSRPFMPSVPGAANESGDTAEQATDLNEIDPRTPIGQLAGDKDSQPIEIDNTPKEDTDAKAAAAAAGAIGKAAKAKKDRKKRIPDFNRFRTKLIIGAALLLLLLLGGYWALAIAPKATVTLRTESKDVAAQADFTADTEADEIDLSSSQLPARSQELKRSESEKVAATGQKDNGTKAAGQVTLRNCTDNEVIVPSGTQISSGNITFITQGRVELDDDERDGSGNCKTSGDHTGNVEVTAQNNGDQYNLSPRTYTVSGFSGVVAQGSQMSGGSSKIVKVISAQDVETAKKRITDKQSAAVEELKSELQDDGYIGIVDTFSSGNPIFNVSPAAGSEANEGTVSAEITYSMLGVKEDDLKRLVEENNKDDIDLSKQSILDYGFDDATYEVGKKTPSTADIKIKTTLVAGPELDQSNLKKDLAGKKGGEGEDLLKIRPGITDAKIELSPFWVTKVPGKESKVNFVIQEADGTPITN